MGHTIDQVRTLTPPTVPADVETLRAAFLRPEAEFICWDNSVKGNYVYKDVELGGHIGGRMSSIEGDVVSYRRTNVTYASSWMPFNKSVTYTQMTITLQVLVQLVNEGKIHLRIQDGNHNHWNQEVYYDSKPVA